MHPLFRLSHHASLYTALAAILLVMPTTHAQSPSGPTIAPVAPGAVTQGWSPLFNPGTDGIWNLGEGSVHDTGGVVSPSDPALLQRADIRVLKYFGVSANG